MAFFAIIGKTEATRGARRWSLDNKRKDPIRMDWVLFSLAGSIRIMVLVEPFFDDGPDEKDEDG